MGEEARRLTPEPEQQADPVVIFWQKGDPLDGPERWYPIPGYESYYFASTHGRIMRIAGGRGARARRILRLVPNKDGYPTVRLCVNNKPKTFNVHVLICRTFHGEPPEDEYGTFEVCHGPDPDYTNCSASNVKWGTRKENVQEQWNRYYAGRR